MIDRQNWGIKQTICSTETEVEALHKNTGKERSKFCKSSEVILKHENRKPQNAGVTEEVKCKTR